MFPSAPKSAAFSKSETQFGYLISISVSLSDKLYSLFSLSFLASGDGVTQLDLVNATHLRPPTISVILKELEADGIVERRRDEADMRSIRVYLTDKGRELDRRNISKIKQLDAVALDGLDNDEQETLMRLLGKIRDNLLDEKNVNKSDMEENHSK